MSGESEVARLREQMEAECQAMRLLMHGPAMRLLMHGPAMTASHRMIAHKYKRLSEYAKQLEQLVGEKEATNTLGAIYASVLG